MRQRQKPKSEYGQQLEEKQSLKETYGLRERQFRRYFDKGKNPESIMRLLETRLDNVVYRCGFASTRAAARQLVGHGHIQVNGRNVNLPSFGVKINDTVSIHPSSINIVPFKDMSITLKKYNPPDWISLDKDTVKSKIVANPKVEETFITASIRPIIELYSR